MTLLERNLSQLARRSARLAHRLAATGRSSRVHAQTGRSGLPSVSMKGDRETAIHSRIDPAREASRLVQSSSAAGFVLVFGLGLGYHLRELLQQSRVQLVLVIDYDTAVVRAFLEFADLTDVIGDQRLALLVDAGEGEIESWIAAHYVPVLHGGLTSVSLRGRVEQDPEPFAAARRAALSAAGASADEFAVQAAFGRNWMRNIALNVAVMDERATTATGRQESPDCPEAALRHAVRHAERCVITAAGPSLDRDIELIGRSHRRYLLIATDSSVPALLAAGLRPDVVLAIDCQAVSYLHVLDAGELNSLLVADIGVHHAVVKRFPAVRFVGGNHPLVRFLVHSGLPLSFLDTSDGSVTHAAVRLGARLGFRSIEVYGADFAYPRAAAYARGTYMHTHYLQLHARLNPVSSCLLRFVWDTPEVTFVQREGGAAYVTPLMQRYRERYRELIDSLDRRPPHGDSADDEPPRREPIEDLLTPSPGRSAHSGAQDSGFRGKPFLVAYTDALRSLSPPQEPLWRSLSERSDEERNLWLTLLPAAAGHRCERLPTGSAKLLEKTRIEAIRLLEPFLAEHHSAARGNVTAP